MDKYIEYIAKLVEDKYKGDDRYTLGACKEEAEAMQKQFPELRLVKGFVYVEWFIGHQRERKRQHWWLEDPDGNIVDPTKGQFPCIEKYEEYKEGMDIRIGKCMECGEVLWGPPDTHKDFCDDACYQSYAEYMNGKSGTMKFTMLPWDKDGNVINE